MNKSAAALVIKRVHPILAACTRQFPLHAQLTFRFHFSEVLEDDPLDFDTIAPRSVTACLILRPQRL